jgi:YidC/Oxa1 family membrane protein insertase
VIYTGPKDPEILLTAGHNLQAAMDYGYLSIIAKPLHGLLRWFHGLLGDWGLAIILLTILVKLCLLPLTQKSFMAMQKMQQLKPELDKLKKQHEGDKQAFNKAMFALYKRHKVNPLGGCLPMLLQMPIWIALYQTIANAVELFHTPLGLWIEDLSSSDPYYIMPVCMGALMIVQNAISGSTATMEGIQAKMMKWGMPIMFTVFMLFLPSGLVLYILVNTILTIFQNLYIRRGLQK